MEPAIQENSPVIHNLNQKISLLKRYCIWFGKQYLQLKKIKKK